MVLQQLLAQVERDGAAAHDQGVAHRPHRHVDLPEEGMRVFLGGQEGDLIAVLQHKVAVGDDHPAVTLHGTHQNVALEPTGDLADGYAVRTRPPAKVSILLAPGNRSRWEISLAAAISGLMMAEMPICFLIKSSSWL